MLNRRIKAAIPLKKHISMKGRSVNMTNSRNVDQDRIPLLSADNNARFLIRHDSFTRGHGNERHWRIDKLSPPH